jgi:hypothetical protein
MSRFRMSRFPRGGSLVVDDSRSGRPCTCYAPSIDQKLLRDGNKTGLGDLRSAVPAGLETRAERAEQFCYRLQPAYLGRMKPPMWVYISETDPRAGTLTDRLHRSR